MMSEHLIQQRKQSVWRSGDDRVVLPYVETYLSYGCNLRCDFCSNLSPFTSGMVPLEEFTHTLESWSKRVHPARFAISGGEPLLHPDFVQAVEATCRCFPDSKIEVKSNGVLLEKLSDTDLQALQKCSRGRLAIIVSNKKSDILSKKFSQAVNNVVCHDIHCEVSAPPQFVQLHQADETGCPIPANSNPAVAWANCCANACFAIIGNELTYCSRITLMRRMLSRGELSPCWYPLKRHKPMTLDSDTQHIIDYAQKCHHAECSLCPEQKHETSLRQLSAKTVSYIKQQCKTSEPTLAVQPTAENTLFVSFAAYPNPEERCQNIMMSATKHDIPLTWISWGEQWQGFVHHKIREFRNRCDTWKKEGIKYIFMLDAKDVVFADPLDVILSKAADIYEPGTLLFNKEFDNDTYPYGDKHYIEVLKRDGCWLNSGLIFGEVETFMTVFDYGLEVAVHGFFERFFVSY